MSDFTVVIENIQPNIISIETSFIDNIGVVEIERYPSPSVNILDGIASLTINDIPDIPTSKLIGNINVYRIDGLADYLDTYSFDCGTP